MQEKITEGGEYLRNAKLRYQDEKIAREYFNAYQGRISILNAKKRIYSAREKMLIKSLIPKIRGKGKIEVLDIPCGSGRLFSLFSKHGFDIYACDISKAMMSRIPKPCIKGDLRELRAMDVMDIKYPDNRFGIVFCIRLLHRIPTGMKLNVLRELKRVSKGHIILTLAIENSPSKSIKAVLKALSGSYNAVPHPIPVEEFEAMLASENMRIVKKRRLWPFSSEVFYLLEK